MTNEEKSKRIDEIIDRGIIREILPSREAHQTCCY